MPKNVELKARARDFDAQRAIASRLAGSEGESLRQIDTFFLVPAGRLKLRVSGDDENTGELISYDRDDVAGIKSCRYTLVPTDHADGLRKALADVIGVRGEVRKTRTVFLVGQTRVHFDDIDDLGRFIELEVVMTAGQPHDEGVAIAERLMGELGIDPDNLIDTAYIDLLKRQDPPAEGVEST